MNALRAEGIWEKCQEDILKNHGDIQDIAIIPDAIKRIYKTSFDTSPYAFIEVAARAQKWVDQAISRNMYLSSRDINTVMEIYSAAWEKGLKTTYYLHMKPQHTAEQSTISVNKSTAIGKSGFGALFAKTSQAETPVPEAIVKEEIASLEAVAKEVVAEQPPAKISERAEAEPVKSEKKELPKTPAPFAPVSGQLKIILPDDPQDANLCEGCE